MDKQANLAGHIALELLRHDGAAVIWQAQVTAASAYRDGYPEAAEILLKIADAAEDAVRREVERKISGHSLVHRRLGAPVDGWVEKLGIPSLTR